MYIFEAWDPGICTDIVMTLFNKNISFLSSSFSQSILTSHSKWSAKVCDVFGVTNINFIVISPNFNFQTMKCVCKCPTLHWIMFKTKKLNKWLWSGISSNKFACAWNDTLTTLFGSLNPSMPKGNNVGNMPGTKSGFWYSGTAIWWKTNN